MRPDFTMVIHPLHCILYYDPASTDETYKGIWADLMNDKILNSETGNCIIGPQGIAAGAKLGDREEQWYRIGNLVPRVINDICRI